MDSFISYDITSAKTKQSKRMKNAINKLKNKSKSLDTESQKSSSSSQANNGDFNLSEEEQSDKEEDNNSKQKTKSKGSKAEPAKVAPKKKTARGLSKKSKSDVQPGPSINKDVLIIDEEEMPDKEANNEAKAESAPKKKTARGLAKKSFSDILISDEEEEQSPKKPAKRKSTDANPKEAAIKSRKRE